MSLDLFIFYFPIHPSIHPSTYPEREERVREKAVLDPHVGAKMGGADPKPI